MRFKVFFNHTFTTAILFFLSALAFLPVSGCKDSLPPRINPYQTIRGSWFFQPTQIKVDTLSTSTDPSLLVSPISISPVLINNWDEWIVDTVDVKIKIKMTLINNPDVQAEYTIRDSLWQVMRLLPGDSTWRTLEWDHRLNGKRVYQYLPSPRPNPAKNRMEYEVARVRLEGSIQIFKNMLPVPLPPREILLFYWFKMT
ncbi:MAG: hypothetical protein Kow0037_30620 [Calditrichia bacterium]